MSDLNIGKKNTGREGSGVHEELFKNPPPANYPKTKKKKWEDDYKRATFYVQIDTLEEIERHAGTEKGEKTRIINEALQAWLKKNRI